MEIVFDNLKDLVEKEHKKRLEELHKEFKEVQTPDEYNRIREQLLQEFRMYGSGRAFFGTPLQGPPAGAGIYLLKLSLGSFTQKGLLEVREDPLFKKQP
jgi:hypothetical protein